MNLEKLLEDAKKARNYSYSPYSKFPVGAAVLTKDGTVYTGCNVENAAYGITMCAEKVAIAKAVSEGNQYIAVIAIVGDTEGPCRPCGSCRQFILEFGDEITVVMGNLKGETETKSINDLIPFSFSKKDL
ncbi:MAG: cytidine deaminase [Desulfitibacter sp. BRH_c19]|nr:MAG: cytidine deaminase [Desulfitibacter sp. BRH_c19]